MLLLSAISSWQPTVLSAICRGNVVPAALRLIDCKFFPSSRHFSDAKAQSFCACLAFFIRTQVFARPYERRGEEEEAL